MTQVEILSALLNSAGVGFSLDDTHSFAGAQRGVKSITLSPINHRKVEGFASSECEFIFNNAGNLIGVRLNEAHTFDDEMLDGTL